MLKFKHGLFIFSVFFVCSSVQAARLCLDNSVEQIVEWAVSHNSNIVSYNFQDPASEKIQTKDYCNLSKKD